MPDDRLGAERRAGAQESGVFQAPAERLAVVLDAYVAGHLQGAQEQVYPLHSVRGSCGEGRTGIAGCGENDQGGGEQPWIARVCCRIVGVHLNQPRYLGVRVLHQRQEREHQAADPGRGQQRWWWPAR